MTLTCGHSRSLKSVQLESLDVVCCSPSVVTVTVSVAVGEIFSKSINIALQYADARQKSVRDKSS